jgi:hypothetical protein
MSILNIEAKDLQCAQHVARPRPVDIPVEIPAEKLEPFLEGYFNHGFNEIERTTEKMTEKTVSTYSGLSTILDIVSRMRNMLQGTKNLIIRRQV